VTCTHPLICVPFYFPPLDIYIHICAERDALQISECHIHVCTTKKIKKPEAGNKQRKNNKRVSTESFILILQPLIFLTKEPRGDSLFSLHPKSPIAASPPVNSQQWPRADLSRRVSFLQMNSLQSRLFSNWITLNLLETCCFL